MDYSYGEMTSFQYLFEDICGILLMVVAHKQIENLEIVS